MCTTLLFISLGTQRCLGYKKLLPPFTRTWTIIPENQFFTFKVNPLNLESYNIPLDLPSSQIKIWGT